MKSKGIRKLLIIIIFLITILVLNSNGIIKNTTQFQKEMSETTQVGDLNNQIDTLNTEHDAYKKYIAESKAQIASAITDMGVPTLDDETLEIMANNIRSITPGHEIKEFASLCTIYGYWGFSLLVKEDKSFIYIRNGTLDGDYFTTFTDSYNLKVTSKIAGTFICADSKNGYIEKTVNANETLLNINMSTSPSYMSAYVGYLSN